MAPACMQLGDAVHDAGLLDSKSAELARPSLSIAAQVNCRMTWKAGAFVAALAAVLLAGCARRPLSPELTTPQTLTVLWQAPTAWPWLRTPVSVDSCFYETLSGASWLA